MENGKTLERLMNEKNLSMAKLSDLTGVSLLALEYLVQNNHQPKTYVAQKIAKVLNVPLKEIWPDLVPVQAVYRKP